MINITNIEGDTIYFEGSVTIQELQDGTMDVTGLSIDVEETINHTIDPEAMQAAAVPGYGRLLRYLLNKLKKALCPECM